MRGGRRKKVRAGVLLNAYLGPNGPPYSNHVILQMPEASLYNAEELGPMCDRKIAPELLPAFTVHEFLSTLHALQITVGITATF